MLSDQILTFTPIARHGTRFKPTLHKLMYKVERGIILQDNQFYQKIVENFENYKNQQPIYPDMTYTQQPPRDNQRPPRRNNQPPRRDNQPPMRDNRPPMRDNRPPMRDNQPPPGRNNQPPFTPPPPPFTPPRGETQQPAAPRSAPPSFSPQIPLRQDGPRGIRGCLYRNTFIWLNNGNSFWFFPTFVGRQAVAGFRWRGFGWTFERINLNRIRSFQCF